MRWRVTWCNASIGGEGGVQQDQNQMREQTTTIIILFCAYPATQPPSFLPSLLPFSCINYIPCSITCLAQEAVPRTWDERSPSPQEIRFWSRKAWWRGQKERRLSTLWDLFQLISDWRMTLLHLNIWESCGYHENQQACHSNCNTLKKGKQMFSVKYAKQLQAKQYPFIHQCICPYYFLKHPW